MIDVTKLEYIDSAGIGMLVGCNGQIDRAGGKMRVAGAQGAVARVFEVTGLDRIFTIRSSLADVGASR